MFRRIRQIISRSLQALAVIYIIRWMIMQLRGVLLIPTADTTPPIRPADVAPRMRRIILSDLHLGKGDRLDDFEADEELTAFIHYLTAQNEPIELIFAGDTFEFLQIRVPNVGDYDFSSEAAEKRLRTILSAHAGPVRALCEFIAQPYNQLTFLIGNHDFELHYSDAKESLRQALGLQPNDEKVRFGISYEGGGIYLEHGNQFDAWNRFVNFEGISEPFEIVRGTRVVKDVINPLEDDPLDIAPLLDNVKPTSAFYWYVLSLPRLRRPEARRYAVRAHLLLLKSVALPRRYHTRPVLQVREELLGPPGATFERELALQAVYEADAELRQAAAASHGGVEPEFQLRRRSTLRPAALVQAFTKRLARVQEGQEAPEIVLEDIEQEAERQLQREIREFHGAVLQAMARIAAGPEHGHNALFVCGHTHVAQIVELNDRQSYVNTGTWTTIIRNLATMEYETRRFPFLDVQYPQGSAAPQWRFLLWRGPDSEPEPWSDTAANGE